MKLILHSSTFFWTDQEHVLLYNTEHKTSLYLGLCPEIKTICDQWADVKNLYVAHCDDNVSNDQVKSFIHRLWTCNMGDVFKDDVKEISFPPILKIEDTLENLSRKGWNINEVGVLGYLVSIKAFLGGSGDNKTWFKQTEYPMTSIERLDPNRIISFVKKCDGLSLSHLTLIISEWDRNYLSVILDGLSSIKKKVRFVFSNPDTGFRNDVLDWLVSNGYSMTQVCPSDFTLRKALWIPGREYHLLVRSEDEFMHWESLLQDSTPEQYDFIPIADNNEEFFRKNVFLSEEEILGQKLSKKAIFRHQALNVNQFGTFYIFPDGTIHPAADAPTIGTLEDSVHQTIIRELEENHAWRQTRRLMSPCKDCIYHDLCPSPSVYERILGVPACNVKQIQ